MNNLALKTESQDDETFLHGYDVSVQRGPLRLSMAEPEPQTARAALMCEETCGVPTPHDFQGRRQVIRKGVAHYDDLIYQCRVCGQHRTWGTEIIDDPKETA